MVVCARLGRSWHRGTLSHDPADPAASLRPFLPALGRLSVCLPVPPRAVCRAPLSSGGRRAEGDRSHFSAPSGSAARLRSIIPPVVYHGRHAGTNRRPIPDETDRSRVEALEGRDGNEWGVL